MLDEETHYVVLSGGIGLASGAKYEGEVVPRAAIPDGLFAKYLRKQSIRPATEDEIRAGKVTLVKSARRDGSVESRVAEHERTIAGLQRENREQADRINQLLAEVNSGGADSLGNLPDDLQGRDALLKDERFVTIAAVAHASNDDLLSVKGVAQKTLDAIREVIPAKK